MGAVNQTPYKITKTFSITKFDTDKRLVYGIASGPLIDGQGEIITPAAIKEALPDYMQYGNLRYMHQGEDDSKGPDIDAVGKVIAAEVKEDGRTYITAKIFDDNIWAKIKAGILQGFSIGADVLEYTVKMVEGVLTPIITRVKINEFSVVDRPAYPEARILAYKMQGVKKPMATKRKPVMVEKTEELAGILKTSQRSLKKAATPEKVIQSLLDLHNDMITNGNTDGAGMLVDAIANIQAATQDQSADLTDPNPDPNADDLTDDDSDLENMDDYGVTMNLAAGDPGEEEDPENPDMTKRKYSEGQSLADSIAGEFGGEKSNPALEMAGSGTVTSNRTSNEVNSLDQLVNSMPDSGFPADPKKAKELALKMARQKAAQIRKGAGTTLLGGNQLGDFITVSTELFKSLTARLDRLEKMPRSGGPSLTAISRGEVTKSAGGQGASTEDKIAALIELRDRTTDRFKKQEVNNQIAKLQIRQSYGFVD
jgi:hypothetical protein